MDLKYIMKFQKGINQIDKKDIKVIIEQVSAMPGQGVTSMFNFGQSYRNIKGNLCCNATVNVFS